MESQAHCETEFHHPAPKCGKHPAIIKIGNESSNKKMAVTFLQKL